MKKKIQVSVIIDFEYEVDCSDEIAERKIEDDIKTSLSPSRFENLIVDNITIV